MSILTARVDAGALWLDEHSPGWATRINLDNLRMAAGGYCILGQLFGEGRGWNAALGNAGLTNEAAQSMAFDTSGDITYEDLDRAWHGIVYDRQREALAGVSRDLKLFPEGVTLYHLDHNSNFIGYVTWDAAQTIIAAGGPGNWHIEELTNA